MDHLQLELALSNQNLGENRNLASKKKKRTFHESFSDETSSERTLPLLIWGDDRSTGAESEYEIHSRESSIAAGGAGVEESAVVTGWPPVKPSMRKMAEQHRRESTAANYITVENGGGGGGGGSSSKYVKVEMAGVGIARKIDLSIHRSYETLTSTLIAMFGKRRENLRMYKLTYKDKEGDWLLAGDVPWGRFVESVRRLKLTRGRME